MKIDNVVRIVDGVLQTTPSIDAFENIVFESERIARGDLFIDTAHSKEAIHQAIAKGAYAIVSTHDFEGLDEEIAWIRVTCMELCLIKLLRYRITQKSLRVISATPLHAAFLNLIHTPSHIVFAKGNLFEVAKVILKLKKEMCVCVSDASLCSQIAPSALWVNRALHVKPFSHKGLFLSSFWWKEQYYHDAKIPSLFYPEWEDVLVFCEEHGIAYSLENLSFTEHFYPQFVTPSLRKKEFGGGEHVLIFEPSLELFQREIDYLQSLTPAQPCLICVPTEQASSLDTTLTCVCYDSPHDISILASHTFCYALILGERVCFESLLTQPFSVQPSLF